MDGQNERVVGDFASNHWGLYFFRSRIKSTRISNSFKSIFGQVWCGMSHYWLTTHSDDPNSIEGTPVGIIPSVSYTRLFKDNPTGIIHDFLAVLRCLEMSIRLRSNNRDLQGSWITYCGIQLVLYGSPDVIMDVLSGCFILWW